MLWLKQAYGNWSLADSSDPVKTNAFLKDLLKSKKFETWGLEQSLIARDIGESQPQDYSQLCSVVYLSYARHVIGKNSVCVWGDKNNYYVQHLKDLHELYPNARYLHIVRDGRDVACSYREVMSAGNTGPYAPKLPTQIEKIAREWAANVVRVKGFCESRAGSRSYFLQYEKLVEMPEQEITRLLGWLGLSFEAEMLSFYQSNLLLSLEPAQMLGWKQRTLEPISERTVGRYLDILSEDELARFEGVAGSVLDDLGYTR